MLHKIVYHCISAFRFGSCETLTFLDYVIWRSTSDVLSKLFHMYEYISPQASSFPTVVSTQEPENLAIPHILKIKSTLK